jgi:hypothetical protein
MAVGNIAAFQYQAGAQLAYRFVKPHRFVVRQAAGSQVSRKGGAVHAGNMPLYQSIVFFTDRNGIHFSRRKIHKVTVTNNQIEGRFPIIASTRFVINDSS